MLYKIMQHDDVAFEKYWMKCTKKQNIIAIYF